MTHDPHPCPRCIPDEVDKGGEPIPLRMGRPHRWVHTPAPRFRCVAGHVTRGALHASGIRCTTCREPAVLTFPEDTETPERRTA